MSTAHQTWETIAQRHLVLSESVPGHGLPLSDAEQYLTAQFFSPALAGAVASASSSQLPTENTRRTIAALLDRGVLQEHRAEPGIPRAFNPRTLGDPALLADVAAALAEGRAVIVKDALRPELAEEAYASLTASTAWQEESYFQPDRPYFQFRRWTISWPLSLPPVLHQVARSLGAPESKALMQSLAGADCSGSFVMCAASNRPGDYSLPHNDNAGLRALTYIWYVSKGWRPDWGGHLAWCPTGSMVTPEFNSLVLFRVSRESLHFVTPVAPHAQGGRLSVSGWWQRADAIPDGRPAATTLGGIHLSPGVYGEPTSVIGGREGVVAL